MINKNMSDISYQDIQDLWSNKIDESDSLDYKEAMIEDGKLLKQICAFANTRGGDIVFGIRGSRKGGPPEEILWIDAGSLNKERIEQIVLSHITPRLTIEIRIIKHAEKPEKVVMIIRVPDSYMKPHQNTKNNKYYKRFQFESVEMSEQEICDCYKKRFLNHDAVEQYIKDAIGIRTILATDGIDVGIVVIPSNIDHRIIDTSDNERLEWIKNIQTSVGGITSNIFRDFNFCGEGIVHKESYEYDKKITVHRNGCIAHRMDFDKYEDNQFPERDIATRLIQTLQFSSKVLQHYGYFGEVRISVCVISNSNIFLGEKIKVFKRKSNEGINCVVDREHPLQYVADNDEKVSSSIMDEILNYFGEERCTLFNRDGTFNQKD